MTCISGLAVVDADAERLLALLTSLPALRSICGLYSVSGLTLRPPPGAALAAAQDFLALAARAIGRCSCLQDLHLVINLADKPADRVPATFWQYMAKARALEHLTLTVRSGAADAHDGSATTNVSNLITGLAGLSRLRTLTLSLDIACQGATLPACVSRLVQLTSLSLERLRGLRCAPGWARLPALECLTFEWCGFSGDGEAALPGMDSLVSLTSLSVAECSGLHVLPTSLWRLSQLRCLFHWTRRLAPVASLPATAPCFPFLDSLSLSSNLPTWPACVLAMTRLADLDLTGSCFERLPEGVSALTALTWLGLGRHYAPGEVGGSLDVRALGDLACFPNLCGLSFDHCSVLFDSSFSPAVAHPCLEHLVLIKSYPACGPSCRAFLVYVVALMQQGRADMLLHGLGSIVQGAGQQDSQSFRGALQAVGFALHDDDSDSASASADDEDD